MSATRPTLQDSFQRFDAIQATHDEKNIEKMISLARDYEKALIELVNIPEVQAEENFRNSLKQTYLNCQISRQKILEKVDAEVSPACFDLFKKLLAKWDIEIKKGILKKHQNPSIIPSECIALANTYLGVLNIAYPFLDTSNQRKIYGELKQIVFDLFERDYLPESLQVHLKESGITTPSILEKPFVWKEEFYSSN